MLENNIYNIDREFDYATVKTIVLKSLVKIAKEEALKKRPNVSNELSQLWYQLAQNYLN
jgi:hypothetical protein